MLFRSEHVIVIHRVQCVDDGLFQLARGKLRKDTHAELGVDMNDVRVKILNDAQALDVDRVGQSIPVNAFEGDVGAVQNTILNIMAYGLGAGGDDVYCLLLTPNYGTKKKHGYFIISRITYDRQTVLYTICLLHKS